MPKRIIQIISHLVVCIILSFLFYRSLSVVHYSDTLFYIGTAYVMIGLFLFVVSRKFFDITASSFQKVLSKTNRKKQLEDKHTEYMLPSERVNKNWIRFFLINGISLNIIMFIFLLLFY
ncbi:DUF3899 domain-containing protein [Gracilibacillus sp. S3-1-1]|uniref:DUF3899 domain-containing protein n=1 Tax=Gracilibacillus pellucidus TaxID=3095368 RepID=A0ACC6M4E5_9BACI|nr:DUF3899 domain-containing protein [Gracilibacillus sp. S3-1-1]MDX8045784.1 DUF3899 domain-containing protein [Gracilibacillus sp. S3-1-1]